MLSFPFQSERECRSPTNIYSGGIKTRRDKFSLWPHFYCDFSSPDDDLFYFSVDMKWKRCLANWFHSRLFLPLFISFLLYFRWDLKITVWFIAWLDDNTGFFASDRMNEWDLPSWSCSKKWTFPLTCLIFPPGLLLRLPPHKIYSRVLSLHYSSLCLALFRPSLSRSS